MFIKIMRPPRSMDSAAEQGRKGWIVVSLGGSLIVPKEGINTPFLEKFCALIRRLIAEGHSFVLITGGGQTCRLYQQAATALRDVPAEDLDWLGIHATRLNAQLIRTLFREEASPRIITDPNDDPLPSGKHRIIVGAGWRPGWSTDYDAAVLAGRLGAERVINLSNVAHVCSEDPKMNPGATRFDRMTWTQFRAIIGDEWRPGLHAPFDPIAAKLSQEAGLEVAILSADDFLNVERALKGEPFVGTLIRGP